MKAKTVLRDWQYGKIPYLTQPDEEYESKENKPLKEKNESEAEKQQRMEIIEKRKEIEQKINIDQGKVFWFQRIPVITHISCQIFETCRMFEKCIPKLELFSYWVSNL